MEAPKRAYFGTFAGKTSATNHPFYKNLKYKPEAEELDKSLTSTVLKDKTDFANNRETSFNSQSSITMNSCNQSQSDAAIGEMIEIEGMEKARVPTPSEGIQGGRPKMEEPKKERVISYE